MSRTASLNTKDYLGIQMDLLVVGISVKNPFAY